MEIEKEKIELIITHFLQGEISEEEIKELRNWISKDDSNKKLFFELKSIYELRSSGLMPTSSEREKSWKRLVQSIKEKEKEKPGPELLKSPYNTKPSKLLTFFRYLAVAAISTGIILGMQSYINNNKKPIFNEIETQAGSKSTLLILPDGSKVTLNAESKLKYPAKFRSSAREVYLDGEAYFAITPNKKQPFIVITDRQQIKVLGTSFNVMNYKNESYAITTLKEGSIETLFLDKSGAQFNETILKPNEQTYFNKRTNEVMISNIDPALSNSWLQRSFQFKDQTLSFIFDRLQKLYDVNIIIEEDSLKQIKYTGTFSLDQSINEVLDIINFEKQFTYKKEKNNIFIKKK